MPAALAAVSRRTNPERSAATRGRLLDATIETLADLGYARTTTSEVAARAGVSRGAHLYHFRTREELIAAAVTHLFDRRVRELRAALTPLRAQVERALAVIDFLWAQASGSSFEAWIELCVAARTDVALRAQIRPLWSRFARVVAAVHRELFPYAARTPTLDVSPFFALVFLQGLALDRGVVGDRRHV